MTTAIPVSDVTVMLKDGDDRIASMTARRKSWEPATRSHWRGLVDTDRAVIDVGAYTGVYAIASAMMGAKVIALEPHPANFTRLQENRALNEVMFEAKLAAASNSSVPKTLSFNKPVSILTDTATLGSSADLVDSPCSMSVQCMKLDDLDLDVGLIKIDVEGHEACVLHGAIKMLRQHHPTLIVEILNRQARIDVEQILRPLGYRLDRIMDTRNHLYMLGGG
jgi:FkbM family methyltransferase